MIFEDAKKNKRKTYGIVLGMTLLLTLIIYYICYSFNFGYLSIVIAFAFSIISSLISYFSCDKIVLSLNKAKIATEEEYAKLNDILDELCLASGLPKPKLYVIEDGQPNAFATGRNPEHSVVCVTTGLLEKMTRNELQGVIAHELAHIKNYDILLSTITTVMVGMIVILTDMFSRTLYRRSSNNKKNNGGFIMLIRFTSYYFITNCC